MNDKILADAFLPFGVIVDVTLPKPELPSSTDPHRGFGYVEFELAVDAREAIDNMDQSELFGRIIKVAQAKPQKDSGEGLGSKVAVWEQEGYLAKHAVRDEDNIVNKNNDEALQLKPRTQCKGSKILTLQVPSLPKTRSNDGKNTYFQTGVMIALAWYESIAGLNLAQDKEGGVMCRPWTDQRNNLTMGNNLCNPHRS